jgi:hypothetical protein
LFGFLSFISYKKWFKEIYVVYLPVGHTHEKVDGILFARIGQLKKTEKCETPEKFQSFVTKAFKKSPIKPQVDRNMLVWDWKAWLSPFLRDLRQFKDCQAFRFTLNQEQEPTIMYKTNILESTWVGFEGSLREGKSFVVIVKVNVSRNSNPSKLSRYYFPHIHRTSTSATQIL